jgi:hypothetical protein
MYPYNFQPSYPGIDHKLLFVVMPFEAKFDPVYDLIKKATDRANRELQEKKLPVLKAYRTKDDPRTVSGWMNIMEHLFTAKIVLGVMTGNKPNVFYELGIAHATQPITRQILIAKKGYRRQFDTKDIIDYTYGKGDLINDIDPLAEKIVAAVESHMIEEEKMIHRARMLLGPYELLVLGFWGNKSHFSFEMTLKSKEEWEKTSGKGTYDALAYSISNLCRNGVLGLNILPGKRDEDTAQVELQCSYYWTSLGLDLIQYLNIILPETTENRRKKLPQYFGVR